MVSDCVMDRTLTLRYAVSVPRTQKLHSFARGGCETMRTREGAVVDYLVRAPTTSSLTELNDLTQEAVAGFGFAGASCARIALPGSPVDPTGLFSTNCRGWGTAYIAERCAAHDPAIERIFANGGPFTWTS